MATEREIVFRESRPTEIPSVVGMIKECFDKFVAPIYSEEGAREFYSYIELEAIGQRLRENHRLLIAVESGPERIAGALLLRAPGHVSMFFVASEYQGKGIGKELFRIAKEICLEAEPSLDKMTVNASPNSVEIYKRLGFEAQDQEQTVNGIRFTPMACKID